MKRCGAGASDNGVVAVADAWRHVDDRRHLLAQAVERILPLALVSRKRTSLGVARSTHLESLRFIRHKRAQLCIGAPHSRHACVNAFARHEKVGQLIGRFLRVLVHPSLTQ